MILLCDYLQEKKRWDPTNYFLYDHGWYEFQLKYWCLCFFPAKRKCQILLQGIPDATNIAIYHAVTIEKSEKERSLIQFHVGLIIKMVLDLLKWLKEVCMKKKKEIIKAWIFAQKESSY